MEPASSPSARRRSDGSVRECLFFPVLERNEQERLEALMRRSMERSLQLEQRPKRWTWGGPAGASEGDRKIALPFHPTASALAHDPAAPPSPASQSRNVTDFMSPPHLSDPPLSKSLSSSATLAHTPERASPSPHRSSYRGSPIRADRRKTSGGFTGPTEESRGTAAPPKTPQTEKQGGDRGTTPTLIDPLKRLESPTTPSRCSSPRTQNKNLGTPKRVRSTKTRAQSPCSPGPYPPSPMRHRASTPSSDSNRKWEGEEKGAAEGKGYSTLERKPSKPEASERKIPKSTSRDLGGDRSTESPGTPTGKSFAGTTDAEEASRLLAERRRLARVQKELEEKQRVEEERQRAEELQRRQAEEQQRQEEAARQAEEQRQRQEEERGRREEEDRRQKERRWKDMQDQLDREREEACLRAYREAERKRQERELLKLQEEQERLQRKKRIEEIMKRTRKTEAEPKLLNPLAHSTQGNPYGAEKEEVQIEPPSPNSMLQPVSSPMLERRGTAQVNGQTMRMLEVSGSQEMKAGVPLRSTTADSPLINLEPLETKSCGADDLSDGVQSMDVSPVSRDELISIPDFSPVNEVSQNSMSNALEDLLDLTGQASYPKLPPDAALGDLNKNLIAGFSNPAAASQLIRSLGPTSDKVNI